LPWSDSAYYLSLISGGYTDADTIKAVAEEKLEKCCRIKTEMGRVMTQTAITLHNPDGPNLQRERGL
jgi:hypothetical protein